MLGHVKELGHRNVVMVSLRVLVQVLLEELNDRHVHVVFVHLVGLVNGRSPVEEFGNGDLVLVNEALNCLVIEQETTNSGLKELGHRDIILFQILCDSGLILGKEFSDSDIKELSHSDVVGLEEARGGSSKELGDGNVILEELCHRYVVIGKEFGDSHVVGGQEVSFGSVEELGDGHIVGALSEELSDRNIVLKEFSDCRVQVLVHGRVEELSHSYIIGAT